MLRLKCSTFTVEILQFWSFHWNNFVDQMKPNGCLQRLKYVSDTDTVHMERLCWFRCHLPYYLFHQKGLLLSQCWSLGAAEMRVGRKSEQLSVCLQILFYAPWCGARDELCGFMDTPSSTRFGYFDYSFSPLVYFHALSNLAPSQFSRNQLNIFVKNFMSESYYYTTVHEKTAMDLKVVRNMNGKR